MTNLLPETAAGLAPVGGDAWKFVLSTCCPQTNDIVKAVRRLAAY